jgi:hypothetical protein
MASSFFFFPPVPVMAARGKRRRGICCAGLLKGRHIIPIFHSIVVTWQVNEIIHRSFSLPALTEQIFMSHSFYFYDHGKPWSSLYYESSLVCHYHPPPDDYKTMLHFFHV